VFVIWIFFNINRFIVNKGILHRQHLLTQGRVNWPASNTTVVVAIARH